MLSIRQFIQFTVPINYDLLAMTPHIFFMQNQLIFHIFCRPFLELLSAEICVWEILEFAILDFPCLPCLPCFPCPSCPPAIVDTRIKHSFLAFRHFLKILMLLLPTSDEMLQFSFPTFCRRSNN